MPVLFAALVATACVGVPSAQQRVLNGAIAEATAFAVKTIQTQPSVIVSVKLEAIGGGSIIAGALHHPDLVETSRYRYKQFLLTPHALTFATPDALLCALETAVTYKVGVRLSGMDKARCCLTKPAITVTGHFEGAFAPR